MYKVDLNSDLGESFGAYRIGNDDEIIKQVTSVNVACGYHAGDPVVMDKTVAKAKAAGVAVGAHPGYPDLMGFGRRNMGVAPDEAKAYVKYQVGALMAFTKAHGVRLQHVKPHGALYNAAGTDLKLARALCEAVAEVDASIVFLGLAMSQHIVAAKEVGLKVVSELFADRAYMEDGQLTPRSLPNSVIHDPELTIKRVVQMITKGTVVSYSGKEIEIQGQSICVHGDNPAALESVKNIRAALKENGVEIVNLDRL